VHHSGAASAVRCIAPPLRVPSTNLLAEQELHCALVASVSCACDSRWCAAGHASTVPETNGVMSEIGDCLCYEGDILQV
jgi:hypothetical protein